MKKIIFVLFALVLSIPSFAQLRTGYCRALKAQRINNKRLNESWDCASIFYWRWGDSR